MNLGSSFLLVSLLLLTTRWTGVDCQAGLLGDVVALLGILPTSQILLAGSGLVGIKIALLMRLYNLLGFSPRDSGKHLAHLPGLSHRVNESSESPVSLPPPTSKRFGLPSFALGQWFGEGGKNQSEGAAAGRGIGKPEPRATVSPVSDKKESDSEEAEVIVQNETAFFPIPGLRIGVDNKTGRSFLLFDQDSAIPMVLVPPAPTPAATPQMNAHPPTSKRPAAPAPSSGSKGNVTNDADEDQETSESRAPQVSYLYYPLLLTSSSSIGGGSSSRRSEAAVAPISRESQLLVKLANGSFARVTEVSGRETLHVKGFFPGKSRPPSQQSRLRRRRWAALTSLLHTPPPPQLQLQQP